MTKPAWDRYSIVAEIHRRGSNLDALARSAGLTSSACKAAVIRPQLGGEIAISAFLGVALNELWPERYRSPLSKNRSNALEHSLASQKKRRRSDHRQRPDASSGAVA